MVVNLDGEQQMERKTAWRVLVCSKRKHINYLDLYAIKHAITDYREMWQGCKLIRIRSNNTTAIAYTGADPGLVLGCCKFYKKNLLQ